MTISQAYRLSWTVPCRICGVAPGEWCITAKGNAIRSGHMARFMLSQGRAA